MNIFYWILQLFVAAVVLIAGAMKLAQGKDKLLADPTMSWVEDFSDPMIRIVGGLEVAVGLGLILPWAFDVAPILTPLSALGVIAILAEVMLIHRRRGETQMLIGNSMLALTAAIIALGRFADL